MSWLERSELPFVDMMAAHLKDFADFSCSAQEYLDRYYIGHYSPTGNLFCAFAMRSSLLELLRSPPPNAVVTGNQASRTATCICLGTPSACVRPLIVL